MKESRTQKRKRQKKKEEVKDTKRKPEEKDTRQTKKETDGSAANSGQSLVIANHLGLFVG